MADKRMMDTHWVPLWPSSFFKLVTVIDTMTRETHTTTSRQISLAQSSFLGLEKVVSMMQGKPCLGPLMWLWSLTYLTRTTNNQLEQVEMLSQTTCLWKPPWFTFSTRMSLLLSDYTMQSTMSGLGSTELYIVPCSLDIRSLLLTNSSRLPDMTPWEPPWHSICLFINTSLPPNPPWAILLSVHSPRLDTLRLLLGTGYS